MGLIVEWVPLDIKITLPAFGLVRTPLLTTYELYNRSSQLIQLDISVDASEAFMFAGYKQVSLHKSLYNVNYNHIINSFRFQFCQKVQESSNTICIL